VHAVNLRLNAVVNPLPVVFAFILRRIFEIRENPFPFVNRGGKKLIRLLGEGTLANIHPYALTYLLGEEIFKVTSVV
jgi:hypothetical protein